MFNSTHMYDNGGEENIKKIYWHNSGTLLLGSKYQTLLAYMFGNCVVVSQGLVVRKERTT